MCRLIGWIGEIGENEKHDVVKILKSLILTEMHNNPHGLGIYAVVTKNGEEKLKKWESGYKMFLELRDYMYLDRIFLKSPILVMCHLRFATTGEISARMSHPYKFSHIVGAHNGVLTIRPEKEGESDSKTFFRRLNKRLKKGESLPAALQKMIGEREIGDFAFTFWDRTTKKLFFIRRRRPLVFFKTPLGLFWASTEEMWEQAKEIAKVSIDSVRILTKENVLYTISEGEVKKVCEIAPPLPKGWWEWDSYYSYSYPRYSYSRYSYSSSRYNYWHNYWPEDDYWHYYDEEDEDKETIKRLLKKS